MKLTILLIASGLSLLMAADQKTEPKHQAPAVATTPAAVPAPSGTPLPEVEALKLQNFNLQQQLAQAQADLAQTKAQLSSLQAQVQQADVIRSACTAAGIPLAECTIDLATRMVKRTAPPPPQSAQAAKP